MSAINLCVSVLGLMLTILGVLYGFDSVYIMAGAGLMGLPYAMAEIPMGHTPLKGKKPKMLKANRDLREVYKDPPPPELEKLNKLRGTTQHAKTNAAWHRSDCHLAYFPPGLNDFDYVVINSTGKTAIRCRHCKALTRD